MQLVMTEWVCGATCHDRVGVRCNLSRQSGSEVQLVMVQGKMVQGKMVCVCVGGMQQHCYNILVRKDGAGKDSVRMPSSDLLVLCNFLVSPHDPSGRSSASIFLKGVRCFTAECFPPSFS